MEPGIKISLTRKALEAARSEAMAQRDQFLGLANQAFGRVQALSELLEKYDVPEVES